MTRSFPAVAMTDTNHSHNERLDRRLNGGMPPVARTQPAARLSRIRWLPFFALICLVTGFAHAADNVTIEVDVDPEEVFVGDSVEYYVKIQNMKDPPEPDLSAIKKLFDVVLKGNQSQNKSFTSIINGRRTDSHVLSHIYQYSLTPKSAGDLTIPAVTLVVDGKTISSREVELRVIEPEKQDLVLVEVESNHTRVYPTQPFTVTARILIHPLPTGMSGNPLAPVQSQPPHLQINWSEIPAGLKSEDTSQWLRPLLASDGVGFTLNEFRSQTNSFFDMSRSAVFDLEKGREDRDGLDGTSIHYHRYELSRTFTPERTGHYSFGPVSVKGVFVSGIERRKPVGRRLVAIAPAIAVEVREVPSPRPATFCGGIGEYKVLASANPTKLRVGDPLTLTVEFERGSQSGSLELVSAPDLSTIPQLASDFELLDKNPTGRVEGSVKKFAYAMRPKRAHVTIPSLSISTFDPQHEDFIDYQTASIPLDVTEAMQVSPGDLVGSISTPANSGIKSRAQGIFQNVTDPTELRDERIDPLAWFQVSAGVWVLMAAIVGIVKLYHRKSSDLVWIRRQQARKSALRRLEESRAALRQGNRKEALSFVRAAIMGLVADMSNRISEGLTTSDVSAAMSAAAIPDADRIALLNLLESIESAEYGGGESSDAAVMIESAATLISKIHPYLERSM